MASITTTISIRDKATQEIKKIHKELQQYQSQHDALVKQLNEENKQISASEAKLSSDIKSISEQKKEALKSVAKTRSAATKEQKQELKKQLEAAKKTYSDETASMQARNNAVRKLMKHDVQFIRSAYAEKQALAQKELKQLEKANNFKRASVEKEVQLQKEKIEELRKLKAKEDAILSKRKQFEDSYVLSKDQVQYNKAQEHLNRLKKDGIITLGEYEKALKKERIRLKEGSKATNNFTNDMVRHMRQIETLIVGYYALTRAWDSTIGKGLQVNKMIEDNTYGVAALISANTRNVDSLGNTLSPLDKFIEGQRLAKKTMEQLRVESLKTPATYKQLTEVYQQAIGQTMAASDAFGGSVAEIDKNTIKLSQRFTNVAGAIGMDMTRVKEEIRSALTGNVSTDSIISTMIFGSPTAANEAIREAKKRTNGLRDLFNEVFKPFDILASTRTYQKGMLQMQNSWEMMMADIVQKSDVFSDITDLFYKTSEAIVSGSDDIVKGFDDIYDTGKKIVGVLDDIAIAGAAYYGAKGIISAYEKLNDLNLKNIKSGKRLLVTTRALALANPFATWTVGITAVLAGMYELQRISEQMSKERFTKSMGEIISSESGSLTTASSEKDIEKAIKKYVNVSIPARANVLLENIGKDNDLTRKTEEAIKLMTDEVVRLNGLLDGSAKKLEDAKRKATLLTNLGIDKTVLEESEKFIKKEKSEIVKLEEAHKRISDGIVKNQEKLNEELKRQKPDQLALNILAEALNTELTAQEAIEKKILEIQNKLGKEQDAHVKSYYEWLKAQEKDKKARQEALDLAVKLGEAQRRSEIASASGVSLSDEFIKQLEAKSDLLALAEDENEVTARTINLLNDYIAKTQKAIGEKIAFAKAVGDTDEVTRLKKALADLTGVTKAVKEESSKWNEIISAQLGNSFADAIQNVIDGDFDFSKFVSNLATATGEAMVAEESSNIFTETGKKTDWVSMIVGVVLMGVGKLMEDDTRSLDQIRQDNINAIDAQTDSIVNALDEQTKILTNFGDNLEALRKTSLETPREVFRGELAKEIVNFNPRLTNALQLIDQLYGTGVNENFALKDQVGETFEYEDILYYLSDMTGKANALITETSDEFQTSIGVYANSLIDVKNIYDDLSGSLKSVYDSLNDNFYANIELAEAQNTVNDLIGDSTFNDYLVGVIDGLDSFGTDVASLESKLTSENISDQISAINTLEATTGESFENNTANALDYLESIELVGEAMAKNQANIKAWEDSFKSQGELASDMLSRIISENLVDVEKTSTMRVRTGDWYDRRWVDETHTYVVQEVQANTLSLATTMEELDGLYVTLKEDADGLTEADKELLDINKALIEQTLSNTYSQKQFADSLNNTETALAFAKEQLGEFSDEAFAIGDDGLPTTIDGLIALRQAFLDNDGVIDAYEQAIIDATLATDPFIDAIEEVSNLLYGFTSADIDIMKFSDEVTKSTQFLNEAMVALNVDALPQTKQDLIDLYETFRLSDDTIDVFEQAIIDATLATDPFVEAIEEIAMTLNDATSIVGDSITNSVSAVQMLLSAGRDMTTSALVSNGDSASLMTQFRENLSKTLSSAKVGDVKASTYAQETISTAQAYIQMLEETGATSRDIGFGKARIAQELSLMEGGEIETTLNDIMETSIDYLGETSPIVEWLKTINGSVSDMSFQEYETQKKNEQAYNIVAEELGIPVPFAEGGIVTKPTLGWMGEAGYPEISTNNGVIPLKNPNDPLNSNAIIAELISIKEENKRLTRAVNNLIDNTERQLQTQRATFGTMLNMYEDQA